MGDLCLASQKASLCVKGSRIAQSQGNLEFALNEFDLKRLRPWLPDNFRWQAVLSADGRASWRGNQPTLHATVRTTPGTSSPTNSRPTTSASELGIDFERQQAAIRVDFASEQIGNIDTDLLIRDPAGRGNLGGQLRFDDLKLATLRRSYPKCAPCKGSSRRMPASTVPWLPLLYGELNLKEGSSDPLRHGDPLQAGDPPQDRRQPGRTRRLHDGGQGPPGAGGWLSWAQQPVTGSLTIQGKELEAQYPGMGRVRVTPDIAISLGRRPE
jgi:translocation and assembly module TamB